MADSSDSSDKNMPAVIHGPKAPSDAEAFGPVIDLQAVDDAPVDESQSAEETAADDEIPSSRGRRLPHYAPLAAGIALAAMGGAIAGVAATMALSHDAAPPANLVTVEATKSLQNSVAQLGSEFATLKAGVTSAQKNASTQLGKIADRLDRAEKAQAEPTGKLAKIQESIDRLEHHQQVAAAPAASATADASDITGSIKPKEDSKPQVAEGWRLRDYFDGHAIIEGKNGTLFRVGQGSVVPGLGKVETIKRDNGKVVVVTGSGIIAASLEPQRRPSYYPRW
jgi:hypothetical protein